MYNNCPAVNVPPFLALLSPSLTSCNPSNGGLPLF